MKDRFINGLKRVFTSREFWGYVVAVAIMAIVSIAYFHPDAFQGNSLNQADMQQGAANGQEIKNYREETGIDSRWTNSLFGGMPTFQISPTYPSDSLFKWIDVAMRAGLPEPSGYVFSMMMGFLVMCACLRMRWYYALIGAVAWGLSSYFIIIIGAGHLWKFNTLVYVPPVIGGVIMAYRGRILGGSAVAALFAMMQIAANHVQMSYYFMFLIIALALAFLISAFRQQKLAVWCKATCALAGAAALAVAANSPSLYNTYKYSQETIRGRHSLLSGMAQKGAFSGLDKDYILQYSYGRAESFTLLIPNVKGGASVKPVDGEMTVLSLGQLPEAEEMLKSGKIDELGKQYLEYASQYFGEPESTNGPVYVGAIICALFLLGCFIVKGPLKWSLLALTVLSVLLALGRNFPGLSNFFIDYVPMYKNFRTPESILVVAEFAMPLLAILALARFLTESRPFHTYKMAVNAAFGIALLFCLAGALFPGIYGPAVTDVDFSTSAMIGHQLQMQGYPGDMVSYFSIDNPAIYRAVTDLRYQMVSDDSWRSFILIALTLGILWLGTRKLVPRWVMIAGVGLLVTGDLYTADKRYLSHESFAMNKGIVENYFPMRQIDREILADTCMNYRVMDIPSFWQAAPSFYHKTIGGYHAAKLTRYQDLIDRHLGKFYSDSQDEADWNILNMLNARYIVGGPNHLMFNPDALGNAWLVDNIDWVKNADEEMEALDYINPATTAVVDDEFKDVARIPAPVVEGDTIFETTYAPDRLTYHATVSGEALAVFSEIYFPWGWTATVDGEETPIIRANYVLRAINIPPGSHTVEMRFDPPSVHSTVTWARISIILIYLLVAAALSMGFINMPGEAPEADNQEKQER